MSELSWTNPWNAHGAELQHLVFNDLTSRWIFSHRFRLWKPGNRREVQMVNDSRLVVDYSDRGTVSGIGLSMHVIVPERLGKVHAWGMDISPGAKTYFEFAYRQEADAFVLHEITRGARDRVSLDGSGLVRQVGFPFPVPDRIELEHGRYSVEYLAAEGCVDRFRFPKRVSR